jgi:hypothetical protein
MNGISLTYPNPLYSHKEFNMKNTLRLILLSALIILSVTMMVAQTVYRDVVYLKNGSVIKGTIVETVPEKSIKIETVDGNLFVYNLSDIEKLTKEAVAAPSKESKPVIERLGNDEQRSNENQRSYESPRSYESQRSSEGSASIFSIYGALALPLGSLGKTDGDYAGRAKTGWSAGLQFVTGGTIGFLIDGSYSQNKIDVPTASFAAGKLEYTGWTTILGLAGLKIGTDNSSGTNFFVAPLVGVMFEKSPEVTFTPTGSSTSTKYMNAASGTGFAYGGAVEAILGGHVTLGAKFVASKLKYKYSVDGQDYESDAINRSLLLVCLGFAF